MTGNRSDDEGDLEKLERMRHFPANVGSRDLEGAGVAPPLLVVCPPPDSWGQSIIKDWHSGFGMTMDLVEEYDLIPREDLPRQRLVLFHVYPFFDARTGSCFSRKMLRNMQVGRVTEPQVPLLSAAATGGGGAASSYQRSQWTASAL